MSAGLVATGAARTGRGAAAVTAAFVRARAAGRRALVAYLTAGFPDRATGRACVVAAIEAGADVIELGVPFSDPIADGPVIQAAGDAALKGGMTFRGALQLVADLRQTYDTPVLLMTYLNPVRSLGEGAALDAVAASGADGLIIPDLIPDEGEALRNEAHARGLALVFLAAPNSAAERLERVAAASTGFLYAVGLEGVTGERDQLAPGLGDHLARVRAAVAVAHPSGDLPIAVGFGVSRPEHVRALGTMADGIIVGSAVVRRMSEGAASVGAFLRSLKEAS